MATLSFSLASPLNPLRWTPRLGKVKLARPESSSVIDTPSFTVSTSRGVVPHLSRDHIQKSNPIRCIHIHFESFLEYVPPVPTLQSGQLPLHSFLGYSPSQHILLMSLRDPADDREMPPNGKDHVSAQCVRGVRKVTRSAWRSYVQECKPDVVIALSDTPFTPLPHSQRRLTKSIQRSTTWLTDMLSPIPGTETPMHPNVLVHMAGGSSVASRTAFAESLMETLHDKEAEAIKPLHRLDDGLAGYVFDLTPLRSALSFNNHASANTPPSLRLLPLMTASLTPVSDHKPRLVNSTNSPHEMLLFILHVGIDLFDAQWAQDAADHGVALDFRFPVPDDKGSERESSEGSQHVKKRANGKLDLGHNLYDIAYAHDFSRLAMNFLGRYQTLAGNNTSTGDPPEKPICACLACSPMTPSACISHSSVDEGDQDHVAQPPNTRVYLHHLLQTHEMSAHSLLTMHNFQVLDAFFTGVRDVLASPDENSRFAAEVERFTSFYDDGGLLFEEAIAAWKDVDAARGKGRLAREKAKEAETSLIPEVET